MVNSALEVMTNPHDAEAKRPETELVSGLVGKLGDRAENDRAADQHVIRSDDKAHRSKYLNSPSWRRKIAYGGIRPFCKGNDDHHLSSICFHGAYFRDSLLKQSVFVRFFRIIGILILRHLHVRLKIIDLILMLVGVPRVALGWSARSSAVF